MAGGKGSREHPNAERVMIAATKIDYVRHMSAVVYNTIIWLHENTGLGSGSRGEGGCFNFFFSSSSLEAEKGRRNESRRNIITRIFCKRASFGCTRFDKIRISLGRIYVWRYELLPWLRCTMRTGPSQTRRTFFRLTTYLIRTYEYMGIWKNGETAASHEIKSPILIRPRMFVLW